MKQYVIASDEQLKSILLNHRYPKGNIHRLLEHTVMAVRIGSISLCTHLTEDDWAFTHEHEPRRFVVDAHSAQVRDTNTGEWIASFSTRGSAINYAEILNSRPNGD